MAYRIDMLSMNHPTFDPPDPPDYDCQMDEFGEDMEVCESCSQYNECKGVVIEAKKKALQEKIEKISHEELINAVYDQIGDADDDDVERWYEHYVE